MTQTDTILRMIFDRWNASLKNFDSLLRELPDEAWLRQIAPGRNTGIYLLGHMIAVHDDMIILLGLGEKRFPALYEPFIKSPDDLQRQTPTMGELRSFWAMQCEFLKQKFESFEPAAWFEGHTAVSPEDFASEPHRNKLNIILTRTTHLQYHLGQLVLLQQSK